MRSKRYGLGVGCHMPDKSGLPSGVLGAAAARFGLPSAVRGIPGVRQSSHCAPNETGSSNNAASAIRDMQAHSWSLTVAVYFRRPESPPQRHLLRPDPSLQSKHAAPRSLRRWPRRKVYLDAGFTNLAESTVGLSSTFSTYVVMLSAGLTPTTRTMYGTFTPPASR